MEKNGRTAALNGNFDEDTAKDIVEIFKTLAHEQEKCGIVVTHSKEMAEEADKVILLKNGRIGKF